MGNATYGVTRTDVSKIYSGYFNGSQCGFDSTFELNNITNGVKTLKVQIIANDGTSTVVTRNITVQRNLQARSCLDAPVSNATVTTDSLSIKGWALNSKGIKSVEAFIDNTSYGTIKYGVPRADVNKVYPGYPSGDNSGFDGTIDISSLSNGNKTLKVVITGNDGTVQTINRAITVKKVVLEARSCLDEPTSNATVTTDSLSIKGWALNSKGIKSVEAFIDNTSYGTIKYGVPRADVNKVYPGYPSGDNSGFDGTIDISSLSNGNKTLKIVITGNDGTTQTVSRTINVKKVALEARSCLDVPSSNATVTTDSLLIKGWALNSKGIKSVEAFIDNVSYGTIKYGTRRTDVNKVYPGYSTGDNCGFEGSIDISSLSNGNKTLKIVITGNNGTIQTISRVITVKKSLKEIKYNIEEPSIAYAPNGELIIQGWAISMAGIKSVSVSVDGKSYGEISYGLTRSDVKNVYPNYPDSDKSGFKGIIDLSSLSDGNKQVVITIIGKDDAQVTIAKSINKVTLTSRNTLDSPASNSNITDGKITVSGWALSEAGTKEVRVSVDGKKLGTATINLSRTDVYNVYPYYNNKNAGYKGTFDVSSLGTGIKTLVVEIEDKAGNVQTVTRKFTYGAKKVIYIDPGHDYGGDMGAVRVINGVTYDETTLNIEVAEYLRTELINKGYEVIMARRIGERPTSNNYRENLWNRINAANNANADFYISIHQNASTTTSANGVEAYYSSVKPDSLNDITYKLNTSKAVAASISSGIASALSMTNRGTKDDEFMVVKYTNMPAVLVECGFISNESDAKKISNATNQKKIASVIADSIHNALK
ncbi:N-acetylmuramoyl-L-alanine amidase [uncultured Clostridium sp.]|uniref:N-acetylmuramoyl-L-alanine amidase n=2 Tax=Clostridium TaxID=1485 RepID=UPI0034A437D3